MANIQINIVENGTTTLATSGCICDRNIDINVDVPTTGEGGGNRSDFIPDDSYQFTGDCQYKFANNSFAWFVNLYGNEITTTILGDTSYMFHGASDIERIPFEFNFKYPFVSYGYKTAAYMFNGAGGLQSVGKFVNWYPSNTNYMFSLCKKLRELPEIENANWERMQTYAYSSASKMFYKCHSLRNIPTNWLENLWGIQTTTSNCFLSGSFTDCYSLDEIVGIVPKTGTISSNMFGGYTDGTFTGCSRVKDIIFATQEDGTPYSVNWKNQTIDLTKNVGYAETLGNITSYNSGITSDKQVTDATTYQALKDDPDWFTTLPEYSRYNHDSLVNTINSLPDASAYGTNTIKIRGDLGKNTDGGATGNLTEEELAIATAKGWTITFTTSVYGDTLPT